MVAGLWCIRTTTIRSSGTGILGGWVAFFVLVLLAKNRSALSSHLYTTGTKITIVILRCKTSLDHFC